jgi:chemotaxis signal transduction protein
MDDTRHLSRTFLVFDGPECRLAIDAMQVRSMRPIAEWEGQSPVDLEAQFGVQNDPLSQKSHRVLVLETEDEHEVPVSVRGVISIETVPGDSVVPGATHAARELGALLAGVVENQGTRTLLLAPDSLYALAHAS